MNPILQRYQQLNDREQRLVLSAAIILALLLFYYLVWAPLNQSIDRHQTLIDSRQSMLQWVKQNVARAEQLRGGQQQTSFRGSLPQMVNHSASQANISIARMQPQGDELQVWVDSAAFDKVLDWLHGLEQQGIVILDADFAETETSGFIRIRRLRLGAG
ncbi:Type II secretion system protein M [Saliniradius amylolyticus]|uniref:Type II secretion system protein M n=1 Tax=Saliniradius amylolyticus TaxID=2183582 RepID=A0A2S2E017_9ALTE|nr:type II secretion system protein M [Saliniradius amylolyticus]AWL10620.1 Type II secretion system protein M [Saliniradius amylolyticus]